ncbi:hypothetical protein [Pseudomonas sp. RGM 3321]|uniref:hypothetical protein n=1 Tax=Pseudomonas sp. RGM 3321 TaxID=2930089 RepID=UPI001FCAF4C0|nr:hypothetical protein [Pseudomonas sp. RGM 3321]MCJ2370394.1 hypothetical protein [Pseudomonas sp. RGM 3321]
MNEDIFFEKMRDGSLVLHFLKICVKQDLQNGITLTGHGQLKINPNGALHVEMVCTDSAGYNCNLGQAIFPKDPFDASQTLHLSATSLSGTEFTSSGFSIRKNVFYSENFLIDFSLASIEWLSEGSTEFKHKKYLKFEVAESCAPPSNKVNTIINSLGSEKHDWNQCLVELADYDCSISIVDQNSYVEVHAKGDFDIEEVYQALVFYLGITSGRLPQPYAIFRREEELQKLQLRSVSKMLRSGSMPAPFPKLIAGCDWPSVHYEILQNMLEIKKNFPERFSSTYAQWLRVWHAHRSDPNVTALTLSVAIEGILNDIYIPHLESRSEDTQLDNIKSTIIEQLKTLKLNEAHAKTLIDSVTRWGNIHPKKALSILVEKELLRATEKKSWVYLRGASAHPKSSEISKKLTPKQFERIGDCLTLFYKLTLHVYRYKGPHTEYGIPHTPPLVQSDYFNVLE